uniref:Uncharacterized protein n=1 Tax=Romanomermis culicivorax TaxID=13658 RepID=A0A915JU97_ROMCU
MIDAGDEVPANATLRGIRRISVCTVTMNARSIKFSPCNEDKQAFECSNPHYKSFNCSKVMKFIVQQHKLLGLKNFFSFDSMTPSRTILYFFILLLFQCSKEGKG